MRHLGARTGSLSHCMPWNLALSSSLSCCGASLLQLRQSATSFKLSAAPCVSGGLVLWLCEPPVRYLRGNRQIGYTAPHVSELKPALPAGKLRPNAVTEAKQYLASVVSSFFSSHIGAPEPCKTIRCGTSHLVRLPQVPKFRTALSLRLMTGF